MREMEVFRPFPIAKNSLIIVVVVVLLVLKELLAVGKVPG